MDGQRIDRVLSHAKSRGKVSCARAPDAAPASTEVSKPSRSRPSATVPTMFVTAAKLSQVFASSACHVDFNEYADSLDDLAEYAGRDSASIETR